MEQLKPLPKIFAQTISFAEFVPSSQFQGRSRTSRAIHFSSGAGAEVSFPVCASCSALGLEPRFHSMPRYHRVFEPGHLQFITSSAYRRVPVLVSKCFCQIFDEVLGRLRQEFGFRLVGWVLMPDHFHLLMHTWRADLKRKVSPSLPRT